MSENKETKTIQINVPFLRRNDSILSKSNETEFTILK